MRLAPRIIGPQCLGDGEGEVEGGIGEGGRGERRGGGMG